MENKFDNDEQVKKYREDAAKALHFLKMYDYSHPSLENFKPSECYYEMHDNYEYCKTLGKVIGLDVNDKEMPKFIKFAMWKASEMLHEEKARQNVTAYKEAMKKLEERIDFLSKDGEDK